MIFVVNEFYNKAKEYAIGRPSYPEEILYRIRDLEINEQSKIADIGAGTGLLTNLLGRLGCEVIAVEPNLEMLNECKEYCFNSKNIKFFNSSAEDTQLEEHSIDIITIGQAFHWFDKKLSQIEFKRILKDNGYVLTVFNEIQESNEFDYEYMTLLRKYTIKTTAGNAHFSPDDEKLNFFDKEYKKLCYDNQHLATEEIVLCNASSMSYTPTKLHSNYDNFVEELHNLFLKYQHNGYVTFHYKTEICICQFSK